ncbi:MAG TPA: SsrA-binding protein SmpB [Actinomycetales bacterium]|nr:SsrA-binding protein SmpB [Actinomycetales bacterium]
MAKDTKPTAAERAKAAANAKKVVARNRKAFHEYSIEEKFEAGIVLTGTEVKALRQGRASLVDGWVEMDGGEAWMHGVNIPEYTQGTWNNHAPKRKRKLLLHRHELAKLWQRTREKGQTIVPLELYFVGGRAKVEIALAKGKAEWDKRETLKRKQADREAQSAMRAANRRGTSTFGSR